MSLPRYPVRPLPRSIIERLQMLKTDFERTWIQITCWTDTFRSPTNPSFTAELHHQSLLVTDAYLLGLASKHGAQLVSFDRTLPWQAIRNGTARLVQSPLLQ